MNFSFNGSKIFQGKLEEIKNSKKCSGPMRKNYYFQFLLASFIKIFMHTLCSFNENKCYKLKSQISELKEVFCVNLFTLLKCWKIH